MRRSLAVLMNALDNLFSAGPDRADADTLLESLAGKHLGMFVFADHPAAQISLVDAEGYAERDIVIVTSDRKRVIVTRFDGNKDPISKVFGGPKAIRSLVALLDPAERDDPHVVLLNKDGTIIARWGEPVDADRLYATIDGLREPR